MLNYGRALLTACLLLALCSLATAQAATPAERQLQQYIEEQQGLRERRSRLRAQIDEVSGALEEAQRGDDSPEKQRLEEAREQFLAASEAHEQNPNERSEARLRNAEFRLHLAERRYQSANREVAELETRQDQLRSEELAARDRIMELNSLIEAQRQRAEQARQRQAENRELQQALERERRERERVEREAAQLQALLERRGEGANATNESEISAPVSASDERQAEEVTRDGPLELDHNFTLLTSAEQVEVHKQRLAEVLDGRPARIVTTRILNVRQLAEGRETNRNSSRFRGLGNHQYQAIVNLGAGENHLRVGSDRWTVRIPDELGNQDFVVLMNELNPQATQVVTYPRIWD